MSKKAPKVRIARRASRKSQSAPLGMRAVFAAVQPYDHGVTNVDAFADVPGAVLRTMYGGKHGDLMDVFKRAANRDFPGTEFGPDGNQRASECIDVLPLASFWAGVATCWYVMTAINGGKSGAR